ncbi:hypothetical protein ACFWQL_22490 [Amycolatopsis thermoflava]|uniref:hypothetical protein n=1 Tax=Amycolatopsis thermoflava TaxID=84480 RepID=UPI0036570669
MRQAELFAIEGVGVVGSDPEGREETNVIVPECALHALASVVAVRGLSRDEAIRRLLAEYLEMQEARRSDDRLAHIATVLRYPPAPRGSKQSRSGARLRLRLAAGTTARVRAVALSLPGQWIRSRKDYQARSLTDAVLTAIALAQAFTDPFLAGLPQLLRHSTARALWQAAVAATCTTAELAVFNDAYELRQKPRAGLSEAEERLLQVAEALDEDVAWHSPERFESATTLAASWFRGPDAHDMWALLNRPKGEAWYERLQDLRNHRRTAREHSWTGRGATAVWRARRVVELRAFSTWLTAPGNPSARGSKRRMAPPGWYVRIPDGWRARNVDPELDRPLRSWVLEGRLIELTQDGQELVWPVRDAANAHGWEPVPGVEPIVAAAKRVPAAQLPVFIEAMLVDWNVDDSEHTEVLRPPLRVGAHKAYELGLIDNEQRQAAMGEARAQTLEAMATIVENLSDEHADLRLALAQRIGRTREFAILAKAAGVGFRAAWASWTWPLTTVAEEVLGGLGPDVAQWLAEQAYRYCARRLQQVMEATWRESFECAADTRWLRDDRPEPPDDQAVLSEAGDAVTPTITQRFNLSFNLDPDPPI